MRKIFLISLMLLLIGGLAASCAQKNTEFTIIDYKIETETKEILFMAKDRKNIRIFWLKISGVDVRLRSDGKDHTSIIVEYVDPILIHYKGTILVPYPEDVEKWNNWLNNIKNIKLKKERPQILPERVLPPNSGKD